MTLAAVRFGILGCADIARKLSRAINLAPNAVLVAVGSRSADKASRFITDNGLSPDAVKAYGSYDAVLDDPDVDAVYVPLPTSLHVRWAVAVAEKKKHVLLEKPTALSTAELDVILSACDANNVQFMDGTMWMHNPRTEKMKMLIEDFDKFGDLRALHSTFCDAGDEDYLKNDIRVKPDLDALGALGDVGWYCIRFLLWACNFDLPKIVTAHPGTIKNESGVILYCGASLRWEDGKVATFHCSFLGHLTMEALATGSKGTLKLGDFVIPFNESSAEFTFGSGCSFNDLVTAWDPSPSRHVVNTDLPQEALMVKKFSQLVHDINTTGAKPEKHWPLISRKTQLVVDAVKASIEKGGPIDVAE